MTENLLERAVAAASTVVDNVKPEQYGDPTPCTEWDVRGLLNHMIAAQLHLAKAVAGEEPDPSVWTQDHVGDGDAAARYAEVTRATLAAAQSPGAAERHATLPDGSRGPQILNMILVDTALHTWDLATATGQDRSGDPEVVQAVHDTTYGKIPDALRGGPFAAEQPCDAGAPLADRVAAYLGRKV